MLKRPGDGAPDGMTVDDGGHLWVAMWGGSADLGVTTTAPAAREYRDG
jgi:sugar lactone lactonase YvrE